VPVQLQQPSDPNQLLGEFLNFGNSVLYELPNFLYIEVTLKILRASEAAGLALMQLQTSLSLLPMNQPHPA
jgi:hypothetical protein